jgi:hypothetical protein
VLRFELAHASVDRTVDIFVAAGTRPRGEVAGQRFIGDQGERVVERECGFARDDVRCGE